MVLVYRKQTCNSSVPAASIVGELHRSPPEGPLSLTGYHPRLHDGPAQPLLQGKG